MSSFTKTLLTALTLALAVTAIGVATVRPAQAATPTLNAEDRATLLAMREEEKLARDVYLTLGKTWNVRIFANIARSEQRHMDAVKRLLDEYGIPDPALGRPVGSFADPDVKALYTKLVSSGSQSLAAAFAAGIEIERLDIADLREAIRATTNADIDRVLSRLLAGSQQHLRAFSARA